MIIPLTLGYLYYKSLPQTYGMKFFFNINIIKFEDRSKCKFESSINEVCIFQMYLNELILDTKIRDFSNLEIGKDYFVFKSEKIDLLNSIEKILIDENQKMSFRYNEYLNKFIKHYIDLKNDSKNNDLELSANNVSELIINNRYDEGEFLYKKILNDKIKDGELFFKFSQGKLLKYPNLSDSLIFFSIIFLPLFSITILICLDYIKRKFK